MSRTSRFTLIATVLLGVLLYTITRFAEDLNVAWDGSVIEPPPIETDASIDLPMADAAGVSSVLTALDIDPVAARDGWAAWSDARGFAPPNRLHGIPDPVSSGPGPSDPAPSDPGDASRRDSASRGAGPATTDEAELLALSQAGDAAATQALAARVALRAPFEAIDYYRLAADQGSTFALLRLASLFEALDTVARSGTTTDPAHARRLAALADSAPGNSLRLMAFTHLLAAVRDGGPPIVDPSLLAWLRRLDEQASDTQRSAACGQSARLLMDIAGRRARSGRPPVVTEAPPIFFTAPGWAEQQICAQTADPIESLMDLSDCIVTRFRSDANEPLDLHICTAGANQG